MNSNPTARDREASQAATPIIVDSAEVQILRAFRKQGRISRTEIANITGWSKAKASQEILSLVDRGLLVEVGEGASQGGRRPHLLRINPQLGYIVGMDIGATSLELALADVSGQIVQRCSEPADVRNRPEQVLGRCVELVNQMCQAQGTSTDRILGIGVGVPGPVDFARGVLVAPPLMMDWENFPIRSFFNETFPSAFVAVDNDVNIMALGEQRAGDGMGVDHFIYVKIGTGIGAGIVSNGRIHRGADGCAGDIGHICVDKQGPICRCGNQGCLEAMAAGPAIAERATQAALNGRSPFLRKLLDANGWNLYPRGCQRSLPGRRRSCPGDHPRQRADDRGCFGRPGQFLQSESHLRRRRDCQLREPLAGIHPPGSFTALPAAGHLSSLDQFLACKFERWHHWRNRAGA